MSINIGSNFSLDSEQFLDARQRFVQSEEDLKNWSVLVPEGFEIGVQGKGWYVYLPSVPPLPLTGYFHPRVSNEEGDSIFTSPSQAYVKKAVQDLNDSISSLETSVAEDIQTTSNTLDTKIESVKSGLEDKATELETKITNVESTTASSLQATNKKVTSLESNVTSLGTRLGTAETKITTVKESVTAVDTKVEGVKTDLDTFKDEIQDTVKDIIASNPGTDEEDIIVEITEHNGGIFKKEVDYVVPSISWKSSKPIAGMHIFCVKKEYKNIEDIHFIIKNSRVYLIADGQNMTTMGILTFYKMYNATNSNDDDGGNYIISDDKMEGTWVGSSNLSDTTELIINFFFDDNAFSENSKYIQKRIRYQYVWPSYFGTIYPSFITDNGLSNRDFGNMMDVKYLDSSFTSTTDPMMLEQAYFDKIINVYCPQKAWLVSPEFRLNIDSIPADNVGASSGVSGYLSCSVFGYEDYIPEADIENIQNLWDDYEIWINGINRTINMLSLVGRQNVDITEWEGKYPGGWHPQAPRFVYNYNEVHRGLNYYDADGNILGRKYFCFELQTLCTSPYFPVYKRPEEFGGLYDYCDYRDINDKSPSDVAKIDTTFDPSGLATGIFDVEIKHK